ncbi:uncharacterized protein LOC121997731 [Zingiber officinale]|uniref:uncharacterized protein LOC121997731 n=1 Tax=Zingiber officinale TaxID=94328 RepID=UPI001C4CBA12|nr:uncharacterized protein LOC121997731 [Zingiber officinale]
MAASFSLAPSQIFLSHRHLSSPSPKSLHKSILLSSSSSSSSSFTEAATNPILSEGVAEPAAAGAVAEQEESSKTLLDPVTEDPLFKGCKTCGREVIEKGCNGEGRIQGGIATVPGFGWWPIKAFRPCPGFVATGGRYTRKGQSMDEVAFGRDGRDTPAKSSKRRENKRK